MKRLTVLPLVGCLLAGATFVAARSDPVEPIETETAERVQVNLVLIDTVVLDQQGRTVPGLTKDDFVLSVQGMATPIDTVDASCPEGALDDPRTAEADGPHVPQAPAVERKMVLVFDYYHLNHIFRGQALRAARWIVENVKGADDEVMIASLANGLRIEQRFTRDTGQLVETLVRMEYDRTLWARDFGSINDRAFFDNLATLMDVLGEYGGAKAAVLFSMMIDYREHWDLWYGDVVQRAAVGRTALYPVWAGGLEIGGPAGGSPSLSRLANESGGRLTDGTNDLSLAYARAQRDLACRYTIGFYVDSEKTRHPQRVHVGVKRNGLEVRQPEEIRFWTDEERRASRIRAAFADPQRHDDPLVRAAIFPLRPRSGEIWDALMVAHFPQQIGPGGAKRELAVRVSRGDRQLWSAQDVLALDPPGESDPGVRPVTIYGEAPLQQGAHTLTVVLSDPGGENLETTRVEVEVPHVPLNRLFLRGPVLARVASEGILIHPADRKNRSEPSALEELIGENETVEPLLVNKVAAEDQILVLWEACFVGANPPGPGATIKRRVLTEEGAKAHELSSMDLDLQGRGNVACQGRLESIEPGTFAPGRYLFEVSVMPKKGSEPLTRGELPFAVD